MTLSRLSFSFDRALSTVKAPASASYALAASKVPERPSLKESTAAPRLSSKEAMSKESEKSEKSASAVRSTVSFSACASVAPVSAAKRCTGQRRTSFWSRTSCAAASASKSASALSGS